MPTTPMLAASIVLLASLAGCIQGPAPEADDDSPPADPVVLTGTVIEVADGYAGIVSAHNNGTRHYTFAQAYCMSPYGGWLATLSGPPGEDLDYRTPGHPLGCPGEVGEVPPGAFVNWTEGRDRRPPCDVKYVCDNYWDGKLLDPETGDRVPAPGGTYTWRFTFRYCECTPGSTTAPGTQWTRQSINLSVEVDGSPALYEADPDAPPYHFVDLHVSSRAKSGAHGDCFQGPDYKVDVDKTDQRLVFDGRDLRPPVTADDADAATVVIRESHYDEIGTCGRDWLIFENANTSFAFDVASRWTAGLTTHPGGNITLADGRSLTARETATIDFEDEQYVATVTVYNGGPWPRSGLRFTPV